VLVLFLGVHASKRLVTLQQLLHHMMMILNAQPIFHHVQLPELVDVKQELHVLHINLPYNVRLVNLEENVSGIQLP
jgi:hypothetical protein